jgi:hypothetical protein
MTTGQPSVAYQVGGRLEVAVQDEQIQVGAGHTTDPVESVALLDLQPHPADELVVWLRGSKLLRVGHSLRLPWRNSSTGIDV